MKWRLPLLALLALAASAQAAKHSFQKGEKVTLWANKGAVSYSLRPSRGPAAF